MLVCRRDDDVHPNPHGRCIGSHQEEETVVRLHAEGETGPRRLRGEAQTVKVQLVMMKELIDRPEGLFSEIMIVIHVFKI